MFIFVQAEKHIIINGRSCVNFATHNYFNFLGDKEIEKKVLDAVDKYGIGSCGPRAFYGTFGQYTITIIFNRTKTLF